MDFSSAEEEEIIAQVTTNVILDYAEDMTTFFVALEVRSVLTLKIPYPRTNKPLLSLSRSRE